MRVALVTGASSGIGRATALGLARRGDTVVLASRSVSALEETAVACRVLGAEDVLVVPTDVGEQDAVAGLFRAAVDRFGRVDAVVSAASVAAYGRFEDVPVEVFDHTHRTNILGAANVARVALEHFHDQGGGSLVLIGSVLGTICTPTMSAYTTTKWALHALARTLQIEARRTPGVDVTLVAPGGVNTPIYQLAANYADWRHRPPPPVDSPEKVAEAVLRALDRPRREVSVGLANALMVAGFRLLPPVFDALVGPLMTLLGTTGEPAEASTGNVLEPSEGAEAVHGPWWSLPGR